MKYFCRIKIAWPAAAGSYKIDECRCQRAIHENWFTDRAVDEGNKLNRFVVIDDAIKSYELRLNGFRERMGRTADG